MLQNSKIKVAFIYKKNHYYLSKDHFDLNLYNLFFLAAKRSKKLEFSYFQETTEFDAKSIEDSFDAIILFDVHECGAPKIIKNLPCKIPVFLFSGDCHYAETKNCLGISRIETAKKYGINYIFGNQHPEYFYQFWDKNFNYTHIPFGIEKLNHMDNKLFKNRNSLPIVNTGMLDDEFYKLRRLVSKVNEVQYFNLDPDFSGKNYPKFLNNFKCSIACSTKYVVAKYFESMASGCLTFCECSETNGYWHYGLKDMENCIAINENNYVEKINLYLNNINDKKWQEISRNGKEFAFENHSNDLFINKLYEMIAKNL